MPNSTKSCFVLKTKLRLLYLNFMLLYLYLINMTARYKIILAVLISTMLFCALACAPGGNVLKAEDLLGAWSTLSGYDATEISFAKSNDGRYIFESFLRGRPYESGVWQIKGSDLIIFANGNNTYTYKHL